MGVIIMDGVLFVALLAAGGTFLYWLLTTFTPAGARLRQSRNRARLEREAELVCPIHGPHTEDELVRLASGERACPDCYKETLNG
jgi:glyoxylase-like metal-dependent hydrolase (beta-lactamase superfamily II)